jgi:outer membrane protein, multidrug efflux system
MKFDRKSQQVERSSAARLAALLVIPLFFHACKSPPPPQSAAPSRRIWSFVPQLTQPIFTAGRLGSQVEQAEAQQRRALAQYEKTIQTAFTDVSNALIQYQKIREIRAYRESLVTALEDRKRLAYMRFRGGVDTMLNALNSDQDLFVAELNLAQARRDELLSLVQVYKALGGGWQE